MRPSIFSIAEVDAMSDIAHYYCSIDRPVINYQQTVMNRTRLLVWILALVVLLQVFPDRAPRIEVFAVIAALIYCAAWVIPKFLSRRKNQAAQTALAAAVSGVVAMAEIRSSRSRPHSVDSMNLQNDGSRISRRVLSRSQALVFPR